MKQKLQLLLCLLAMPFVSALGDLTKEVTIDQVCYKLNCENYTAEVISNPNKYSGAIVIPSSVMYDQLSYTVNGIGDRAFYQCTGLTELTIPASISYIGKTSGYSEVFRGCSENVFNKVHISDLEAWCRIAFANDYYANPLGVAHHLYLNDSEITDLVIPSTITTLGLFQFTGCYGLNSVTIPESVVNFSAAVFFDCKNIQSVNIPSGVASIGVNMFNGCTQLTSVDIPNNITTISNGAFKRTGLTSIRIPSTVSSIGDEAFASCTNLNSVTVDKNTPLVITEYTFTNSANATLYVPAGSESAYSSANYWKDFKSIEAKAPDQEVTDAQGVIYTLNNDGQTYTVSGFTEACIANFGAITIPEILNGCSVTSIGNGAFWGHTGLTSVTIPNSVTSIGNRAFLNCTSLHSVTIPNSVTSIGSLALNANFSNIVSLIANPSEIPEDVFSSDTYENVTLYVPVGTIDKYKSANGWNNFLFIEEGSAPPLIDGIYYNVKTDAKTAEVASNPSKYSGEVVIPPTVTYGGIEYSVTSIGNYTFDGCSGLTSVTIPNSVTSIGNNAFASCNFLTSVTIPNNVNSIGNYAFRNCTGLTSVTIPNSVTSIGNGAFGFCSYLSDVYCYAENVPTTHATAFDNSNIRNATLHVPAGSIDAYNTAGLWNVFKEIVALPDLEYTDAQGVIYTYSNGTYTVSGHTDACSGAITIPETVNGCSVTSIGYQAFAYCTGLTSVSIPNSVTTICGGAFGGCSGLSSVVIPNGVISIALSAFKQCSNLSSVTIPASMQTIANEAFEGCNLTSVYISDLAAWCNISVLPVFPNSYHLFLNGVEINDLVIPDNVTSIPPRAFAKCGYLTSVSIPNSVTSIAGAAFRDCDNLTSVIVDMETPLEIAENVFSNRANATLFVPEGSIAAYQAVAPWSGFKNIIAIGTETPDQEYTDEQSVKYTFNVGEWGYSVSGHTEACAGDITIPETVNGFSVTSIGEQAFLNCQGLTSITIPNSVTSLGDWAFSNCHGLTSITIPHSVTFIGATVFQNCLGLTTIIVEEGNTLYDSRDNCNAIVETASNTLIAGCKNTTIPASVTSIGDDAFSLCYLLTSITIPNSVTSIGRGAFIYCSGLTSIIVEEGNTVYDSRDNCNAIIETASNSLILGCKNTTIPNDVTSIGDNAFGGSGLTSVTIPNSVTSIGRSVFVACTGLTSIIVEEGNTVYDSRENCNAIIETASNTLIAGCQNTTIPASVTSIGGVAFEQCYGLASITIPNSVTSIGEYAFYSCNVTSVTCHAENVPTTDATAFKNSNIGNATLFVPEGSIAAYQAAAPWSGFKEIVAVPAQEYTDNQGLIYSFNGDGTYTVSGHTDACAGDIIIPETVNGFSVTAIGYEAFSDCNGLTSLTIPASVTRININDVTFKGCSSLASIVVAQGNSVYDSREGSNAIIEKASNTLIAGCKNTIIPTSVTSIGRYAFCGSGLTSLTIPNSVTSIGYGAFRDCSSLASIFIPSSVTSIGDDETWAGEIFHSCSVLNSIIVEEDNPVFDSRDNCNAIIKTATNTLMAGCKNTTIPSTVTSIADEAFFCSFGMTSVMIPASVTSIGARAFDGCYGLTSVTCYAENVPTTSTDAFENSIIGNATLFVPEGSIAAYSAALPWSGFKEIVVIAGLTLDKTEIYVQKGSSVTLTASEQSVTWESSAPSIATVTSDGVVTGIAGGTATITCTSTQGFSATCEVTVGKVTISKTEIYVQKGSTVPLTAKVAPKALFEFDQSVTWESSNPTVATVTSEGVVTGIAGGTATITCTSTQGFSATCEVTVGKVTISKTEIYVQKGSTVPLTAKVSPKALFEYDQGVTWESSAPSIATVTSDGVVTGIAGGTATITCTSTQGFSATCEVTVGKVTISKTEIYVQKGSTVPLTAKVSPKALFEYDQGVTWESSAPSIATVTSDGVVEGIAGGTATITCTSTQGFSATCEVTVGKVTISKTEIYVQKGSTVPLTAKVSPKALFEYDQGVTWESSAPSIATVTSDGVVTGVGVGTATITCTSSQGFIATCRVTVAASTRSLMGDNDEEIDINERNDSPSIMEPFDVYDLNGRKVRFQVTSLEGLPEGIYIVNGRKIIKR